LRPKPVQNTAAVVINSVRPYAMCSFVFVQHWNGKLAGLAQMWSNKCNYVNAYDAYNFDEFDNFATLGANIWAYQGQFDASRIVDSWYSDKKNFNRITENCESDESCGGYKQVNRSTFKLVSCQQYGP